MTTQKVHRVSVAMSVYNPRAEYFREQVDSILGQTSEPVLVMRNDGSPNLETVALCDEYTDRDNVVVIDGVNLGFAAGFLAALRACPDTDYYAFSDQDDFWLPEKLSRAVEELDKAGAFADSVPVMYHSDFVFCDQNLNEVEDTPNRRLSSSLENAVAEAAIPGMVMVFNRAMRERLLSVDPDGIADMIGYALSSQMGMGILFRIRGCPLNIGDTQRMYRLGIWEHFRGSVSGLERSCLGKRSGKSACDDQEGCHRMFWGIQRSQP